jgi:hypothetical protein
MEVNQFPKSADIAKVIAINITVANNGDNPFFMVSIINLLFEINNFSN